MNKPIKQYKSGAISSSIWANERDIDGNKVEFKTVSLRKSWKDDKNVWRDSTINLRKSDIAKAILVLQKAHEDLLLDGADDE